MRIERTHDMALVAEIMGHPAIWPHIHEDGTERLELVDNSALYFLLAKSDDDVVGVFLVHPVTSICFQMHTCILPNHWGKTAASAVQALFVWIFNETDCSKLISNVPAYNRAALRFAFTAGMQQEGINRASYKRNGESIDQIMVGMTKEEWTCQQSQH